MPALSSSLIQISIDWRGALQRCQARVPRSPLPPRGDIQLPQGNRLPGSIPPPASRPTMPPCLGVKKKISPAPFRAKLAHYDHRPASPWQPSTHPPRITTPTLNVNAAGAIRQPAGYRRRQLPDCRFRRETPHIQISPQNKAHSSKAQRLKTKIKTKKKQNKNNNKIKTRAHRLPGAQTEQDKVEALGAQFHETLHFERGLRTAQCQHHIRPHCKRSALIRLGAGSERSPKRTAKLIKAITSAPRAVVISDRSK